jgi:hypothetical protein
MPLTGFTDNSTVIEASWLNSVDVLLVTVFGNAVTAAEARSALSLSPTDDVTFATGDIGDPGTEATGINVNGTTYPKVLRINDIGGSNPAQFVIHRHSTTWPAVSLGTRSNSNDDSHGAVTAGQALWTQYGAGWTGSHYDLFGSIQFLASSTGTISSTSSPGKLLFQVTANGANTPSTAVTIDQDKSVTLSGPLTIEKANPNTIYLSGYSGQGSKWDTIGADSNGYFSIRYFNAAETTVAEQFDFRPDGIFSAPDNIRAGATAPIDDSDLTRKDYVDKLLAFSPQFTLIAGADDVYPLLEYAQFGFTIDKAYYKTDSGTITAEVSINGTAVTGLSALSLTSTQGSSTATAANTVTAGDKVAITLSSNSSADTVSICLHCTRT